MYHTFESNNISIDVILEIGKIIHYDFSKDIKGLIKYKLVSDQSDDNMENKTEFWRNKYVELLEKYNEPITFHTYDIVGLSTYFEFFNARSDGQYEQLDKIIKKLILNDKGKPAIKDDQDLPIDIAAAAINKIGAILGKSQSKTSTQTTGEQPE